MSCLLPDRPLLPPLLPPDHLGDDRPRYPGGWGSGVGSHPRCAITPAITRRRGGRGRAFPPLARFCLPSRLPSRVPRRVPSLTHTPEGTRRGTPEGTLRCRRVHVDA